MRRVALLCALVLTVGLGSGFVHAQNPNSAPYTPRIPKGDLTVDLVPVVSTGAITAPVFATHAGDGSGRLFIVDQPGQIWIIDSNGTLRATPFLDLAASGDVLTVRGGYDERGLLGLAFHPKYKSNGRFFVRYGVARDTGPETCINGAAGCHAEVLAEFRVSRNDPNVADPASKRVMFSIEEPQSNHNGGAVAFGPVETVAGRRPGHGHGDGDDDDDDDGNNSSKTRYLYFSLGDGGGSNDGLNDCTAIPCPPEDGPRHSPIGNGQDIHNNLGAILRIDVDHGSPYGIPADNPFAGTPGCDDGCDEIYAYGMRNPYRFTFDRQDGRLFLGEVGQRWYEEIHIVRKGGNYGWPIQEGFHCFNVNTSSEPVTECTSVGYNGEPLLRPIAEYNHLDGIAVVGGFVYRGSQPALQGKYIFGDFSLSFGAATGHLFWLDADGAREDIFEFNIASPSDPIERYVLGMGEDEAGEVYLLTSLQRGPDIANQLGEVFRIVAVDGAKAGAARGRHRTHGNGIDNGTDDFRNGPIQALSARD